MIVYIQGLTSGYVCEHENPYDDTLSHMTQLLVSGECERYELKIDYITMDQVCTWSQYMVNILLYGLVYSYIGHSYLVVHINTSSYKIYILVYLYTRSRLPKNIYM